MTLDNILEEIKKAETIVILAHETPDGDAIGSSLAIGYALEELGKTPDIIIPEYFFEQRCFGFSRGTFLYYIHTYI